MINEEFKKKAELVDWKKVLKNGMPEGHWSVPEHFLDSDVGFEVGVVAGFDDMRVVLIHPLGDSYWMVCRIARSLLFLYDFMPQLADRDEVDSIRFQLTWLEGGFPYSVEHEATRDVAKYWYLKGLKQGREV